MKNSLQLSLLLVAVLSCGQPALAQGGAPATNPFAAQGNHGTAGQGYAGNMYDQATIHTSEPVMTAGNDQSRWLIHPPDNTHTATHFQQHANQALTSSTPTGLGLLAPNSTAQFGDNNSFNYVYTCGFPAPQPRAVLGCGGAPVAACGGALNLSGPINNPAPPNIGAGPWDQQPPGFNSLDNTPTWGFGGCSFGGCSMAGCFGVGIGDSSGPFNGGIGVNACGINFGGGIGNIPVIGGSFGFGCLGF